MLLKYSIIHLLSMLAAPGFNPLCEVAPWAYDFHISTFELISYYFFLFTAQFADYPWVIRAAYGLIVYGSWFIIIIVCTAFVKNHIDTKKKKYLDKIFKDYDKDISEFCVAAPDYTNNDAYDLFDRLKLSKKKLKRWQLMEWTTYFILLKEHNKHDLNVSNMHRCINVLQLAPAIEKEIRFGSIKRKKQLVRAVEYLQVDFPESSLSRILSHKNDVLRLYSRSYYMRNSDFDPFRFLEDANMKYSLELSMEVHYAFLARQEKGLTLPSLMPLIPLQKDPRMAAFLIKEIGYWGTDDDMEGLYVYFKSAARELRIAAFRCMGMRKYKPALPHLQKIYDLQTEPYRRVILKVMSEIDAPAMVEFFREAYIKTTSAMTQEVALTCLLAAGDAGLAVFNEMREQASDEERALFDHVSSPLITRDFTLLTN